MGKRTSSEDSRNAGGGASSEEDFDSDDDEAGHKKRADVEPRLKPSEYSEKVRIEKEKNKIHKTHTSVLGVAKYEIGQLVDRPNQEVEETLPLARPKVGYGSRPSTPSHGFKKKPPPPELIVHHTVFKGASHEPMSDPFVTPCRTRVRTPHFAQPHVERMTRTSE